MSIPIYTTRMFAKNFADVADSEEMSSILKRMRRDLDVRVEREGFVIDPATIVLHASGSDETFPDRARISLNGTAKEATPEILFVGGPADGQRRPLTKLPEILAVPVSTIRVAPTSRPSPQDSVSTAHHRYIRTRLVAGKREFSVYMYSSIAGERVIEKLIEGYRE